MLSLLHAPKARPHTSRAVQSRQSTPVHGLRSPGQCADTQISCRDRARDPNTTRARHDCTITELARLRQKVVRATALGCGGKRRRSRSCGNADAVASSDHSRPTGTLQWGTRPQWNRTFRCHRLGPGGSQFSLNRGTQKTAHSHTAQQQTTNVSRHDRARPSEESDNG